MNRHIRSSALAWLGRLAFLVGAFLLGVLIHSGWHSGRSPDPAADSASRRGAAPASPPVPAVVPHASGAPLDGFAGAASTPPPSASGGGAKLHPRDPYEWQGRRVDLSLMPPCNEYCGFAMACMDGRCGPCSEDSDCRPGELCVLEHCLETQQVGCRTRSECEAAAADDVDDYCVIAGVPSGFRGNEGMRSLCRKSRGPNPDDSRRRAIIDELARAAAPSVAHRPLGPLDPSSVKARLVGQPTTAAAK
jgi:hypothetical protein